MNKPENFSALVFGSIWLHSNLVSFLIMQDIFLNKNSLAILDTYFDWKGTPNLIIIILSLKIHGSLNLMWEDRLDEGCIFTFGKNLCEKIQ